LAGGFAFRIATPNIDRATAIEQLGKATLILWSGWQNSESVELSSLYRYVPTLENTLDLAAAASFDRDAATSAGLLLASC
jgi:hypothetical protein